MKFPFLFKHTENTSTANNSTSAWPWPTCASSPKTLSFRANSNNSATTMFNTINSAHVQETDRDGNILLLADQLIGSPSSSFCSLLHDENNCKVDLRSSDRLTFQPGESSSILEEVKPAHNDGTSVDLSCNKEISHVTAMAMDSCDPFSDFRVSMEEMVRAHGLKRWECLEDLLTSYLRVNEKSIHGYIVGAFVDLLVNIYLSNCDDNGDTTNDDDDVEQCDSSCSCSGAAVINQDLHEVSFTSPLSFCSSSCSFSSPSMEVSEGLLVVNNRVNVAEKSISSNSCSSSSLSYNTASS